MELESIPRETLLPFSLVAFPPQSEQGRWQIDFQDGRAVIGTYFAENPLTDIGYSTVLLRIHQRTNRLDQDKISAIGIGLRKKLSLLRDNGFPGISEDLS